MDGWQLFFSTFWVCLSVHYRNFQHPNLVQLYGVVTEKRPIYIVTELMVHGEWAAFWFKLCDNEIPFFTVQ